MGSLRFQRRRTIAPGIRLNLSKSGPSLTFGGRGMHYTVGHGRRRTTVGVPGTGLSYTSVSRRSGKAKPRSTNDVATTPQRKSMNQSAQESPGAGLFTGIVMMLIGAPLLVVWFIGLPFIAVGLYMVLLSVRVLRSANHQVTKVLGDAEKHPDNADAILGEGLTLFAGDARLLAGRGALYTHEERYAEAATAYEQALAAAPDDPTIEGHLADVYLHLGRWQDGIALLDRLRSAGVLTEDSLFSLLAHESLAHLALKDAGAALAVVSTAPLARRTMSESLQLCLFLRGAAHYAAGQHAAGVKDLDRLYAMNPAFAGLDEARSGMRDGTFHLEYGGHVVWSSEKVS